MRLALGFQEPKIDFRARDSKNLIHSSYTFAIRSQIKARLWGTAQEGCEGSERAPPSASGLRIQISRCLNGISMPWVVNTS